MDKFPVCFAGTSVGELTVERENLYTWFRAQACLPKEGLWCLWVIGSQGELRLGVLEPMDSGAAIQRRFSDRMAGPIGVVQRGELRPVKKERPAWGPVLSTEQQFQSVWLRKKLRGQQGLLRKRCGQGQYLAVPYDKCKPFPLVDLFCFARLLMIEGKMYLVISFNEKEQVIFGAEETER